MGLIIAVLKILIRWIIYLTLIAALIVLIPNLPPYTTFTSIELEPTQERVGPLTPNGILNNVEKLYVDKVLGPEAFQLYNGEVYTSLATGEIVKMSPGGHVTFVTKIGSPCTGLVQEHICGRPLGFEIDEKNNQLYVADAYHGIWKVDLKTDKKQLLVSPRVEINGRSPKLFNDLTLAKNGDLYWTDSSSDFQLKDGAFTLFADPSGRLFHYNAIKNESKVLLDNLWLANGVATSHDNQFVVVSESFKYRLMKYYIDGPKKGKAEVFVAGLPGVPDNVRALPDGSGVLVALYSAFDDEHPLISRSMSQIPVLRKFLLRIQRIIEIGFEFLNRQYPHPVLEDIIYSIGHFKSVSGLVTPFSGLVQIDWKGNIVASYFNTDGSISHISDAILFNGKLCLGAPHIQNFIGAVNPPPLLKKAFTPTKVTSSHNTASREAPKPKVVAEPQKAKPIHSPQPKVQETKEVPKQAKQIKSPQPVVQETTHQKPSDTVKATTVKPTAKPSPQKPVIQESKTTHQKSSDTVKTTTEKPTTKPMPQKPVVQESKSTHPKSSDTVKTTTEKPTTKPMPQKPVVQESKSTHPKSSDTVKSNTVKPVTATPPTNPSVAKSDPPSDVKSKPAEVKPSASTVPKQADVKPAESGTARSKPSESQKPAATKPMTQSKKAEVKPVEVKMETKNDKDTKTKKMGTPQKPKSDSKSIPEHIPIIEEIPSDTAKPTKDKLKVIKKNGPAEIPNPNV